MRKYATMLIALGVMMLTAALLLAIWVVSEIGLGTVLAAPHIQVTLGWPGRAYAVVTLGCLIGGLWLRRMAMRGGAK